MSPRLVHGISGGVVASSIDTFAQAQEVTRRYAKTFYFASHALPPAKRQASFGLYSFCRYVDNIADCAENAETAKAALVDVRHLLHDIYDPAKNDPVWSPFRETVRRYGIPKEYVLALIDGVEMDLTEVRCGTFADLQQYCYHVASVVGLMMTKILQPDTDEALPYAEALGTAMQLTNILRDIGEDLLMDRVYLPAAELREWGITDADLRRGVISPAFEAFMQFQMARARSFYEKADAGIALLPNDGSRFCVRLMSALYRRILDEIEKNAYNVFSQRAHVPLPSKLLVAASIAVHRREAPFFLLGHTRRDDIRSQISTRSSQGMRPQHSLPHLHNRVTI
jgi:15-cis-phytoene synthase